MTEPPPVLPAPATGGVASGQARTQQAAGGVASGQARTQQAAALALGVLGLLGLVALASQGPLLAARSHRQKGHLPAVTTWVFAVVLTLGAALFVYGLVFMRRDRRPKRASGLWSVLGIVALALLAGMFMHFHHPPADKPVSQPTPVPRKVAHPGRPQPAPLPLGSGSTWLEVLLLTAGAVLALAAATRPRRARSPMNRSSALADLVGDSLEDVRAEPDPRRAVIAAYARMERGLGASGLARARTETAGEYLGRVLTDQRVSRAAVTRLTGLFEQAKFSHHVIGPEDKEAAIEALVAVRDELRGARPGPAPDGPAVVTASIPVVP